MAGKFAKNRCRTKYSRKKHEKLLRQQLGGFLNSYDCAYAGQDAVNQALKGLESHVNKPRPKGCESCCRGTNQTNNKQRWLTNWKTQTKNHKRHNWRRIENTIQTSWWLRQEKICASHGCATRYTERTRLLINYEKGEKYICAIGKIQTLFQ